MIDFRNVSKSFGDQNILVNSTFRINHGEHVGFVGPNGAGKSTVFSMIVNESEPDKGNIVTPKDIRIGYLHQQLMAENCDQSLLDYTADAIDEVRELHSQITILESELGDSNNRQLLDRIGKLQHQYEDLGGYALQTRAEMALSGLGFRTDDFNRPFNEFSGGWQMRAGMARVLISDPDVLLLDEPSNYLDVPAVEWLQRFLNGFSGTLMLISHDRYLLKYLTTITLEVNAGNVTRYPGDYDYYVRERENRQVQMESAKRNQDRKAEQLKRGIERFRAKNTKAAQAKSWMKKLEKMEEITLPDALNFNSGIQIMPAPHSGAEMVRLEKVDFSYDDTNLILRGINLNIERGRKIAFVGYNGTGKTTLLKILAAELKPNKGKRVLGHKVVVGYQAQEFGEILPPEMSVYDIVRAATPAGNSTKNLRSILGGFGFIGDQIDKPCKVLSGGEKIRLCFARIFVNPPNLLILDEPTTHLDVVAREVLQQAVLDYDGTVCMVSHDIEFIRNTADTVIAMETPGIRRYYGNYDYYCEKRDAFITTEQKDVSKEKSARSIDKERKREQAEQRNSLSKIKRKYENILNSCEKEIENLEEEKKRITDEFYSQNSGMDFSVLGKRMKEIEKENKSLTIQWEEAALELEKIQSEYSKGQS